LLFFLNNTAEGDDEEEKTFSAADALPPWCI
jgi:hypothetical protein